MAKTGDRSTLPEGAHRTKEVVADMVKQMENQILAALTGHPQDASANTAIAPKPTDHGKGIFIANNQNDYCDHAALPEDQGKLLYLVNLNPFQAPTTSQQLAFSPRPLALTLPEQIPESMITKDQIRELIQGQVQAFQIGSKRSLGFNGLDLESFSIVPGIELPENFRAPKFTLYDGNSNAEEHLRIYCRKMAPYTTNDDLMIYTFQDSLTGPALKWFGNLHKSYMQSWKSLAKAFARHYAFNERLAITKEELGKMGKEHHESIKEYAKRWRLAADQVHSTLSEDELAEEFFKTLKLEHREKLAAHIDYAIFQMVKAIERMEKVSQERKISEACRGMRDELEKPDDFVNALSMPMNLRKRDSSFSPKIPFNAPLHYPSSYFQPQQSYLQAPSFPSHQNYLPIPQAQDYPVYHPPASVGPQLNYLRASPPTSHPDNSTLSRKRSRNSRRQFDPIPISYMKLYQDLLDRKMIVSASASSNLNASSRFYNPDAVCMFHDGQVGHDVENYYPLKHYIQDLIDSKKLNVDEMRNVDTTLVHIHNAQQ